MSISFGNVEAHAHDKDAKHVVGAGTSRPKATSVVQLTQQGHAAVNPVGRVFVGVQEHRQDVIGGMAGRGQDSSPLRRLVHGTRVPVARPQIGLPRRREPHQRQHVRQHFRELFVQDHPAGRVSGVSP